jgi:uncharacterized protein
MHQQQNCQFRCCGKQSDVSGNLTDTGFNTIFSAKFNPKQIMRHLFLSLALLITLTSQAQVHNQIKKDKIKALFVLMHQDSLIIKTLDGMSSAMVKNMSAMFNDTTYTNHGIDVSKINQKLMEKSMAKSKENALQLLNEDMVDIYDKYFSAEEIDDFTKFYTSTSGQKLLNKTPDISKDVMAIMSAKYQKDFQQSFMKDMEEVTTEITEQLRSKQ